MNVSDMYENLYQRLWQLPHIKLNNPEDLEKQIVDNNLTPEDFIDAVIREVLSTTRPPNTSVVVYGLYTKHEDVPGEAYENKNRSVVYLGCGDKCLYIDLGFETEI